VYGWVCVCVRERERECLRGCKNEIDDRSNIFPWLGGSNLPPWTIFTKASQIHIF